MTFILPDVLIKLDGRKYYEPHLASRRSAAPEGDVNVEEIQWGNVIAYASDQENPILLLTSLPSMLFINIYVLVNSSCVCIHYLTQ